MLPGHRFGVHLRHPLWVEVFAHLRVQPGQLLDAQRDIGQALTDGREIARHQTVDGAARRLRIDLRIPGPLLRGVQAPQIVFELVAQDQRIDLVFTRQRRAVDRAQFGQQFLAEFRGGAAAVCTQVVNLAIETMIADRRGVERTQAHAAVHPACRELGKAGITLRLCGHRDRRLCRWASLGGSIRLIA